MAPQLYRVRNWTKFQHYKHRSPPWIKLHVEIFSSEDWVSLDDASKLLAIACMVIGSRNDGCVPGNPEYIQRVAYLNKKPNLKPLIDCGFLEIPLADASATQADAIKCLTRGEERRDRGEQRRAAPPRFDEFWLVCPRKIGKDATERAWAEALKHEEAEAIIAAMRGFAGLSKDTPDRFIPGPAKWLTDRRWRDEDVSGAIPLDPETAAEVQDRADRIMRRGKYADKYQ